MPLTKEEAEVQVQERLVSLTTSLPEYEVKRLKTEQQIDVIQKAHDKINQEGRLTFHNQLIGLYKGAINDAAAEEEMLRNLLGKINDIRSICIERRLHARRAGDDETETHQRIAWSLKVESSSIAIPLYVGKPNTKPPPLCGAIPPDPDHIAKPGDLVIAYMKYSEKDQSINEYVWMLVEVVSYNPSTRKYEIADIDEEIGKHFVLSQRRVIPLPLMRANPETDPEALFPPGTLVMALYPRTTCFYNGMVSQPPATSADEYEVVFEDDDFEDGYSDPFKVAQRYVIEVKQMKKYRNAMPSSAKSPGDSDSESVKSN